MSVVPTNHHETQAILNWLLGRRIGEVLPDPRDGAITLSFGTAYKVTAMVCFVLATALWMFAAAAFYREPRPLAIVSAVFGGICLAFAYGLYDAFLVVVKASDRGLESRSPLFGSRSLPWNDLRKVSYAAYGNWYTFRSGRGWAIRISIHRNGLRSFSKLVSANIARSPARFTPRSFYTHTALPSERVWWP